MTLCIGCCTNVECERGVTVNMSVLTCILLRMLYNKLDCGGDLRSFVSVVDSGQKNPTCSYVCALSE